MARRKPAAKREILPDPLYNSVELAKFINIIMDAGKKSIAEKIVYKALSLVSERLKKDKHSGANPGASSGAKSGAATANKPQAVANPEALNILTEAFNNVRPMVEVKSRRVGGATYQVPMEVNYDRSIALAMRWIAKAARERSDKTMVFKLAAEIVDAYKGTGSAVKARDDMHRMAKANQAFAHYRW